MSSRFSEFSPGVRERCSPRQPWARAENSQILVHGLSLAHSHKLEKKSVESVWGLENLVEKSLFFPYFMRSAAFSSCRELQANFREFREFAPRVRLHGSVATSGRRHP